MNDNKISEESPSARRTRENVAASLQKMDIEINKNQKPIKRKLAANTGSKAINAINTSRGTPLNRGGTIATPLETMQITQSEHNYDPTQFEDKDVMERTLNS